MSLSATQVGAPSASTSTTSTSQDDDKELKMTKQPKRTALQSFDASLSSIVKFLSANSAQERSIKLLQWSFWFLSKFCKREEFSRLSGEMSWTRYILRVFGLPAAIEAARTGKWAPGIIGKCLAYSMVAFYPLELGSYVKWKTPSLVFPKSDSRLASKLAAWSCRCWVFYMLVDMYRSNQSLRDLDNIRKGNVTQDGDDDDDRALQHQIHNERLLLIRNALFTLPGIHWSLPNWDTDPWLSETTANGLMFVESMISFYQEIYNFRMS